MPQFHHIRDMCLFRNSFVLHVYYTYMYSIPSLHYFYLARTLMNVPPKYKPDIITTVIFGQSFRQLLRQIYVTESQIFKFPCNCP